MQKSWPRARRAKGSRRHPVPDARTLLASGPHRPLRRGDCCGGRVAVVAAMQDPNPLVAGRVSTICGMRESGRDCRGVYRRRRRSSTTFRALMRAGKPLVTLKTAHPGWENLRARRQPGLDHQRAGARTRATVAARFGRHSHGHGDGFGGRLPVDRPNRIAAQPAAVAPGAGFAAPYSPRFAYGGWCAE